MNRFPSCFGRSRAVYGFALLLLCCVSLAAAQGSPFTSIVIFGDSLSDTGNVAHVTASDFAVRYPGPSFNYSDGRFTDGSDTSPAAKAYFGVWHEQLAKAFFGLTPTKNSLDGGQNYAFGDATTQDGTTTVSYTPAGLPTVMITIDNMGQQVTNYLASNTVDPKALYVLWGGGDDLFNDPSQGNLVAAPARIAALVTRLAQAGAVNILVPNLPPLGLTPAYSGLGPTVAAQYNAASALFDAQLKTDLAAAQANLTAGGVNIRLYQLDIFTLFESVAASPATYGLTNTSAMAQGTSSINPDTYLFWDDVHPTTSGHFDIATAADMLLVPKVVLTIAPPTPTPGEQVTFTAVVTSQAPSPAPTGTVSFYNGAAVTANLLGTGTVDNTGTATFTSSTLAAGTYNVTAVYGGDTGNVAASSAVETVKIAAPSTMTLTLSTGSAGAGAGVTFTATVAGGSGVPTGTVSFLDGTTVLGTGTLNGSGVATYSTSALAVGSHPISASYAGDATYSASVSASLPLMVTAVATTTSLTSSLPTAGTGQAVVFTAAVAPVSGAGVPTGTVTFSEGSTSLGTGTLDGTGKATLSLSNLGVAVHTIVATYGGDANFMGSASAALTETIITPSVSFTATPATITIPHGSSGTTVITGTPAGGYSGAVSLACTGLPVDASCSFAPATLTFAGAPLSTTLTVSTKATSSAALGQTGPQSSGRGAGVLAVLAMPWIGVAGFAAFRRRDLGGVRSMLVLAVLSLAALAGLSACGSSSNTTPKGSYTVSVTFSGTGAPSPLTVQITVQ
ncbi:MAG TPA: Ig-like domain repeat protein [Acidisarcina sp.]